VAAAITALLTDSAVILDLHGGGSWCVNAFVKRFEGSESIAEDMEAPFISNAPNKPGGLTSYAKTLGIQVTNIEIGGRSKDEMLWCDRIVKGLERVLCNLGVLALADKPGPAKKAIDVTKTEAVRSRLGGIFVPTLREEAVGTIVPAGTEMGKILDLHTLEELEVFSAPYPQTAMMLLRPEICVIEGSALIYVVAQPV
jgi:predicted deacylase